MAVQLDQNGKEDLKTQFATREGTYRLMTLSEYSRPNRVGYQTNQNNPQVRVSLVSLPANVPSTSQNPLPSSTNPTTTTAAAAAAIVSTNNSLPITNNPELLSPQSSGMGPIGGGGDRICFNFGKELYVYAYRGCKKVFV